MTRVISYCFLLLAAVLAYIHLDSRPVWAPLAFESQAPTKSSEAVQDAKPVTPKGSKIAPQQPLGSPKSDWLPDTGAASVHAASLIVLKDGGIRAFWFAGSREGAPDVVINSAVLDSQTGTWGSPTTVIDRVTAEKALARYIAKLGNPVPVRLADGRLQLFFVTVSIGGWAGSSITSMISDNEGVSWSKPQRLITSPFLNISTLVKSPAVQFSDGRLGLPVYHEWVGRFGEFLRLDAAKVIDKRRMSSGRGAIQPVIFVDSTQAASALFRQTRGSGLPKQVPVSDTLNAGQSWQTVGDLGIANPNSALAGLALQNGIRLLALNNIEAGRHRLVLMMNNSRAGQWQVIDVLEDDEALPNDQRKEFSYPFLLSANGNDAHLVYTWDRKKIRHLYFSDSWLSHALGQLQNQTSPEQGIDSGRSQ